MENTTLWILGIAVTILVAAFGRVEIALRSQYQQQLLSNSRTNQRIDDVKDKFVRRDDLNQHLNRIESEIRDMREDNRAYYNQVLNEITKNKSGNSPA